MVGSSVVIEGVIVGDYRTDEGAWAGFFVQEQDAETDGDPSTSEGIFVRSGDQFLQGGEGSVVRVAGTVAEPNGVTSIDPVDWVEPCDGRTGVTPATLELPVSADFASVSHYYERFEGMWVRVGGSLTVTGQYELGRNGQLQLSAGGRLRHYGQDGERPLGLAGWAAWQEADRRRAIRLDDFSTAGTAGPVHYPQPGGYSADHWIRLGATVDDLSGVLGAGTGDWAVRPRRSSPVRFRNPPRPPAPSPGGSLRVAAMNVLNYFNGDGLGGGFPTARGANSPAEFERQTAKLVAALALLDADVVGLMEIENDGDDPADALSTLADAVNRTAGPGTYAFVRAGANGGTDAIKVSLLYKPAVVETLGSPAVLDTPGFTDPGGHGRQFSRPALAQTFRVVGAGRPDAGESFTTVVLHLKSRGSGCGEGDDSRFQGNCNGTRDGAAAALAAWLDQDPTGTAAALGAADPDYLLIGDFNAYAREDPMQRLYDAGYGNLLPGTTYSTEFAGGAGAIDHALASEPLRGQVAGAAIWHINADESVLLDYNDTVRDPGEEWHDVKPSGNELYRPGPWRSSDHDPVVVGLNLAGVSAGPERLPGPRGED